ncbi:LysR family transcriptional regulator [Acinetobacter sp. C26M]|uniref:LysR family transcriptional regulator n=1 Tax=unclassified Acinetobacter TaxID=196816 RepID=UPI0020375EBA|nr:MULTISPECIES: LysR family transcriptional regulator [unclassified Acinetobacter]USA45824.1 LysR family transcriptional regulator [Acinetobacter sp. C26M]USA49307.1 LysR family transcriptional regulator [Acinetobacter sp. C26G]
MIERVSLNSLKFFYYVARYESVTVAAEKLFVTQSAVSKQLKNLEESLGLLLFVREARKLTLTSEGEVLFDCCQQVFQQIDQCLLQLQQYSKAQKSLILSCEPTLAMKWLIPRLLHFKQLYPEFEVSLLTGGGAVDFASQNIDLALRRDDFDWGDVLHSEKIADEQMLGVIRKNDRAAPTQVFISKSRAKLWQQFKRQHPEQLKDLKRSSLEHFYLCIEACLAGLGATVVSAYMVEREIKYQMLDRLTAVYADGSAYHLLSAQPFEDDIRKLVFRDWLKDEMQKSQLWLASFDQTKAE